MSNLPVEKNESFLGKMISFFKRLFGIELEEEVFKIDEEKENTTVESNIEEKTSFEESIKTEVSNDFLKDVEREEYLETLEENPSLLFSMPIEKLKVIDNYYDMLIAKEKEKLEKLSKSVNNA